MNSSAIKIARDEHATSANIRGDMLHIVLADGRELSVPIAWFPKLLEATEAQRANLRLIGPGTGIHWPELDEDISIRGLLYAS
jgi:hypothetical protein